MKLQLYNSYSSIYYVAWIGALQYSPAISPAMLASYNLEIPGQLFLFESAGMYIHCSYESVI